MDIKYTLLSSISLVVIRSNAARDDDYRIFQIIKTPLAYLYNR